MWFMKKMRLKSTVKNFGNEVSTSTTYYILSRSDYDKTMIEIPRQGGIYGTNRFNGALKTV